MLKWQLLILLLELDGRISALDSIFVHGEIRQVSCHFIYDGQYSTYYIFHRWSRAGGAN